MKNDVRVRDVQQITQNAKNINENICINLFALMIIIISFVNDLCMREFLYRTFLFYLIPFGLFVETIKSCT